MTTKVTIETGMKKVKVAFLEQKTRLRIPSLPKVVVPENTKESFTISSGTSLLVAEAK